MIIYTCKKCGYDNPEGSQKCNNCGVVDLHYSSKHHKRWACPRCRTLNMWENSKCAGCFNYEKKGGGGCFITTATLQNKGITNDKCYELETFRNFRDNYIKNIEPILVDEYYSIAPVIVKKINTLKNKSAIYNEIWTNYLQKCLSLIEKKENLEAKNIYVKMVNDLKKYIKN